MSIPAYLTLTLFLGLFCFGLLLQAKGSWYDANLIR